MDVDSGTTNDDEEEVPTVFRWEHGGRQVFVTGTFNDWTAPNPHASLGQRFHEAPYIHNLKKGKHAFKFVVDDEWRFAPDQPTVADIEGRINNFIDVTDFDAYTGDENFLERRGAVKDDDEKYTREIPDLDEYTKDPPPLPPHLRHIILNKAPPSGDPNALPVPQHVALNHLYCTAIKDGMMVLGVTYRQKACTTVYCIPEGHQGERVGRRRRRSVDGVYSSAAVVAVVEARPGAGRRGHQHLRAAASAASSSYTPPWARRRGPRGLFLGGFLAWARAGPALQGHQRRAKSVVVPSRRGSDSVDATASARLASSSPVRARPVRSPRRRRAAPRPRLWRRPPRRRAPSARTRASVRKTQRFACVCRRAEDRALARRSRMSAARAVRTVGALVIVGREPAVRL